MKSISSTGFSLVELLVVVAIVGILSSIGIVTYTGYIEGARKNSAENQNDVTSPHNNRYRPGHHKLARHPL